MAIRTLAEIGGDAEVINMYRKILVPLDGSELAEQSLKHALAIVRSDKPSTIVLLTIVEPINPGLVFAPGGLAGV